MLYQFRIDRSNKEEIIRRLREHNELSQGWGGGKEISLDLNTSQFVEECTKYFELKSTRVPSNLTRMRDFQDGDILVTPHLPTEETLTLTVVDGDYPECYRYDESDSLYLNHRIKVKKDMIFGLTENISLYNHVLVAYLNSIRWFRLPVLPLDRYSALFVDIMAKLVASPELEFGVSELSEFLEDQKKAIFNSLKKKLREIVPSGKSITFESVCAYVLEQNGYTSLRGNLYDCKGGDADLVLSRERTPLPFELGDQKLFVQVKKHEAKSDKQCVEQILKITHDKLDGLGCVMSLADDFTNEAKELGENNGIALLNGDDICQLLLKAMLEEGSEVV